MRKGWEIKKVGEVIEIRNGRNQQQVISETGQYPIMGSAGNVMGYSTDYICEAGTTIIGRKGNISKPLFINERFWNVDTAFGFYPKDENIIDKKLIYYLCLNIDFESLNRGTTIPSLVKSELQQIEISFPKSLSDQENIVSILDEAFTAIYQAKENLQRNLQNAKDIFQSELNSIFENKGDDWIEIKFSECFKLKSGDMMTAKMMSEKGIYPVYGGNGISGKHDSFNLSGENIIIGRVGALCGNVRLINEKIWLTDNAFQIVDFHFEFDYSFLTYMLNFKDLRSAARQTAQPVISNSSLKDMMLQFPKKQKEQKKIVYQLDRLSIETKNLENVYQQKLDNLEELKKSILQKAFSGELTMKKVKDFA